jgi:hypothetical protein
MFNVRPSIDADAGVDAWAGPAAASVAASPTVATRPSGPARRRLFLFIGGLSSCNRIDTVVDLLLSVRRVLRFRFAEVDEWEAAIGGSDLNFAQ